MGFVYFILSVVQFIIGLALPAYASLSLITQRKTPSHDEYARWGTYWILYVALNAIFGCLSCLPNFLSGVLLLIKLVITSYLSLGFFQGSLMIWRNYLSDMKKFEDLKEKVKEFVSSKLPKFAIGK